MIKSNDGENKATKKKKAIMSKITTQVDEVKDSEVGHLIGRFADKEKLENARKEFEENMDEINISVVEKEKICSVRQHNTFSTRTTYLRSRYNSVMVQDIEKCYIT